MNLRISQFCGIGVGLALAASLGGCGFTPLYATPGVTPQLAAIQVIRPDGRAGFMVGQSLEDELGHDQALPTRYKLNVVLHETRVPRGIDINNEASRYEMDVVANYSLRDIKSGAEVTKGIVSVNATYDAASQPYASLSGELDGERRAAEAAAQRIRLELATYFASPHPVGTVTPADAATFATYSDLYAAQPIQTPRQRAMSAEQPGAGDIPDPYATPGSAPGSAP
ncbi:MAG TPA: LPS assembly lipoprotein LptE [Caulobacteraceae bacterium]|nr:LPS assembly lipoprotein LptE [Caulobacteraceae bacterium]